MVQKVIFLGIFLFCFPHFCNAFAGDEESPIVAVKHHIPSRYATRHGDLASELAEDPLILVISDNPKVYLHAILLSLGEKCLEASKMILSCAPKAALKFLPDRYFPITADENLLILYDHLTKTTSFFPRIEIKKDLLLLALSYAEASDKCLPREIKLRISRSARLKNDILKACADSELLVPYCLYYKNLYEGLANKRSACEKFLTELEPLMNNGIVLRSTTSGHAVFQNLPLTSLFEDYLRLKDYWTQRHRIITERVEFRVPPSDPNELETLSKQVKILQTINTQLNECVSSYQTKLLAYKGKSSLPSTTITAIEMTKNVIEPVIIFIKENHSFLAEAYRERIMRLYSLAGALKETESPLIIPNLQDIFLEGPHFDPASFVEVGKQLESIRDGFISLPQTLKITSPPERLPLPRASKSNSTSLFWRQKHAPSQTRLGSTSSPSIGRSTVVIPVGSSSEDEATLLSPQGSPTPTTSSCSSQETT